MRYFGPWDDPDGTLAKYPEQKAALHAGRTPRPDPEALTVKDLVNASLNHNPTLLDAGELSALTWGDYQGACDEVVAALGKNRLLTDIAPDDFARPRDKMAGKWGRSG